MWKKFINHFDHMALAMVVWMCILPLVGLFVFPFFGLQVALIISIGLSILILAICWKICS